MPTTSFTSVEDVKAQLASAGYLASDAIATTVYLASELGKPLLIEGPAGVGKTALAEGLVTIETGKAADLERFFAIFNFAHRAQVAV